MEIVFMIVIVLAVVLLVTWLSGGELPDGITDVFDSFD